MQPFDHDITLFRTFKRPLSTRVKFPYLSISELARAFKDFIHFKVYNEFKGMVYAEYNKGLQFVIQSLENKDGDIIDYGLPIFNYDISLEGVVTEVNSHWRSSMLNVATAKVLYEPFYADNELELRVVYRRMKGTIPINIYSSSQPEEIDIQMAFTDAFQGLNKWIVMPIRVFTIIPENFLFTTVEGVQISKSLNSKYVKREFIKAVNKNSYFLNSNTAPIVKLTSLSASNNLYGGKGVPEYNMSGTCEFEIEMPQYILANSINYGKLELDLSVGFQYRETNSDILNDIFGYVLYDQPHDIEKAFSNGVLLGSNALILEETRDKFKFKEFYPDEPINNLPVDEKIELYFDTPAGIIGPDSDLYFIEKDENGDYIIQFKAGISFQKEDLIGCYVFRPYTQFDDE